MDLDFIDISRESTNEKPQDATRKPVRHKPPRKRISKQEMLRRRKKRRKAKIRKALKLFFLTLLVAVLGVLLYWLIAGVINNNFMDVFNSQRREYIRENETVKPEITEELLTPNPYSRPGEALGKVKNIFVHYTANPGTSASQNRSYFENLGLTGETSASAHFVIGNEGEIVQCIPLNEIGYAVKNRNEDSISIECCYLSQDGKFTDATYESLLQLSAWLLKEYKLAPEDMRRHYDEGGKKCPLYYVEHEDAWQQFIADLQEYILK